MNRLTYRDGRGRHRGRRRGGPPDRAAGARDVPARGARRHRRLRRLRAGARPATVSRCSCPPPTAWARSCRSRSWPTGTTRSASTWWRWASTTSWCTAPSRSYFLDYIGDRRGWSPPGSRRWCAGVAEGCRQAGCALDRRRDRGAARPLRAGRVRPGRLRRRASSSATRIIDGARRASGRRRARARRRPACTPTATAWPVASSSTCCELGLDATLPGTGRTVARRAADADADLRASRCSPCSREVEVQRDGARHGRRYHREPAARAARRLPRA